LILAFGGLRRKQLASPTGLPAIQQCRRVLGRPDLNTTGHCGRLDEQRDRLGQCSKPIFQRTNVARLSLDGATGPSHEHGAEQVRRAALRLWHFLLEWEGAVTCRGGSTTTTSTEDPLNWTYCMLHLGPSDPR
jgi:hypothetical protein